MAIIVPKKIKLVCPDVPKTYNFYGEINIGVLAFPVDADGPKSILDKATNWAKTYWTQTVKGVKYSTTAIITEVPNNYISNLKVVSIEHRNNNAAVYKVMTNQGIIFDMQERVFLEAMITGGVKKSGILRTKFIWTRESQHMRLVVVGSSLHKAAKQYNL